LAPQRLGVPSAQVALPEFRKPAKARFYDSPQFREQRFLRLLEVPTRLALHALLQFRRDAFQQIRKHVNRKEMKRHVALARDGRKHHRLPLIPNRLRLAHVAAGTVFDHSQLLVKGLQNLPQTLKGKLKLSLLVGDLSLRWHAPDYIAVLYNLPTWRRSLQIAGSSLLACAKRRARYLPQRSATPPSKKPSLATCTASAASCVLATICTISTPTIVSSSSPSERRRTPWPPLSKPKSAAASKASPHRRSN